MLSLLLARAWKVIYHPDAGRLGGHPGRHTVAPGDDVTPFLAKPPPLPPLSPLASV